MFFLVTNRLNIMLLSNVFLVLPVIFAAMYQSWLYLFLAAGLFIFSPLYHWYDMYRPKSVLSRWFRNIDVLFARCAFVYMYYYALRYSPGLYGIVMCILLSLTVLFFWYAQGHRYQKWHPWFHVLAPIVSSAILIFAHT